MPSLSSLQQQRLALFDRGSRALDAYCRRSGGGSDQVGVAASEPPPAVYRCPLCEQDLERAAALDGRLTLEHVPPRARGGRGIVLTCKPCNNRSGDLIDAAVLRRDEQQRVEAAMLAHVGTWKGRATLRAWGEELTVDLSVHDEPTLGRVVEVAPVLRSNNPAVLARVQAAANAMLQGEPGMARPDYQITPRAEFHPVHARLGDLRAAYLAAFAAFGYTYALSPRLRPVRDRLRVIRDPVAVRALLPGADAGGPAFYIDGGSPEPSTGPTFGLARLRVPFAAVFVDLGTVRVVLPALDGPENPLAAMGAVRSAPSIPDKPVTVGEQGYALEGTWLAWPTTLAARLDLAEPDA